MSERLALDATPTAPDDPRRDAALSALEERLGVRFRDRRWLLRALTHRSWLNEYEEPGAADNERLEFLGDAFIDLVSGEYLFRELPDAKEGVLTMLRSALVQEPTLGRVAARLGLGEHLRLGRGEAQSGGRERPAILCDAIEALTGALYLDSGFAIAEEAVLRWLAPELEEVLAADGAKDPKSAFQERVQATWQVTPRYVTVAESGPDHDKRFVVEVWVGDRMWSTGEGRSKALAARSAARTALRAVDALLDDREAGFIGRGVDADEGAEVDTPVGWHESGAEASSPLPRSAGSRAGSSDT